MRSNRPSRAIAFCVIGTACALATILPSRSLAQAGDGDTRDLLARALAYEHGEGVPKDPLQAAELYCDAARRGDAEAQFALGWMYANGRGVARDDRLAAGLFERAAAQGHAHAERMLRVVGEPRLLPGCMNPLPAAVEARTPGENPFDNLPRYRPEIADLVRRLAPRFQVNAHLALAVIAVESGFNPSAVSPKNAQGLMQLVPGTAQRFNVRNAFDPADNVRGGLAYLRWLLSYYRGEVAFVLAAYNAGEGTVDRHRGIPPYPETRDYVRKVQSLFRQDRHPYDESLTEPSPILAATARSRM